MKPQTVFMGRLESVEPQTYGQAGKTLLKCIVTSGEDQLPFTAFGRLVDQCQDLAGCRVVVEAEVTSREYNGNVYIDMVAREVRQAVTEKQRQEQPAQAAQTVSQPSPQAAPAPSLPQSRVEESDLDDIPF